MASIDRDYGRIPEIRRDEGRRTVKALTTPKADNKTSTVSQPECNYSEALQGGSRRRIPAQDKDNQIKLAVEASSKI